MKIVTKLFMSLCLVAGLGTTLAASAQVRSDATIRANIPYSFVVNNTTLPAGTYVLSVADPYGSDLTVLEIRSANSKIAVLFETQPITDPRSAPQTELVFEKLGDTYFLSRVFLKGDEGGSQLLKSKKQRRLEENGSVAESHSIPASPMQAKNSARKMN